MGGGLCQVLGEATPVQLLPLLCPRQEHRDSPEVLEQIYRCNPILRYTSGPLYAPLLPFPYGSLDQSGERRVGGTELGPALWAGSSDGWAGRCAGQVGTGPTGCEDSAQLLAGGPGEDQGAVNPHPIPQPLAPAATPRCVMRL